MDAMRTSSARATPPAATTATTATTGRTARALLPFALRTLWVGAAIPASAGLVLSALTPADVRSQEPAPSVDARLHQAKAHLDAGETRAARTAILAALERAPDDLRAILLDADIASSEDDTDRSVYALHQWLDRVDAARRLPVKRSERKAVHERLIALDAEADRWAKLRGEYHRELLKLAKDYRRRKDLIAALEVYAHALQVDPTDDAARRAMQSIRRTGGSEVAVEDVFAGADPSFGMTPEQIAAADAAHADWENAWRKKTDNYKYRTNAGFLVLETAAIAMEQMNGFYRKFFRFKEDGGKTPQIEVRIFKNRDEYLTLGQNPVEWSGGHFIGSAVETFAGGVSGKASIREMYGTLFHEAAHQFVSLTGPFVPGWLNEAYASFFEGCVILSNGTVRWNRAPAHRLFPLARRLEAGWMEAADDGVRDGSGEWAKPTRAPRIGTIVGGGYAWGPPWYAPTWGLVYFLYNYRQDDGRLIYRDALHTYYESFERGRPNDPVANFEQIVLGAPLSKVKSTTELDPLFRDWILALRDRESGKAAAEQTLETWGDAALEREEWDVALEMWEAALAERVGDSGLLEKLARLHERRKEKGRAAARWRELKRQLELDDRADDPRHLEAERKIKQLDPLAGRYARLRQRVGEQGLTLARGYEARNLPTMALEICRRMSAGFSMAAALDDYIRIARKTGKTLARWRLAYDEQSLAGWSGGNQNFVAYGAEIRARLAPHPNEPYLTNELTYDASFDADFSLEAELKAEANTELLGLCFGRKDAENLHAVMLHRKGFMDIVTKRGGEFFVLDHRTAAVGGTWHRLRIDVIGKSLDVYYDGYYVRSLDFNSAAALRGGFGLITGVGETRFRNVRILTRDRFDPAAAIERRLAMERIAADQSLRQPGTFSGIQPPQWQLREWVQGDPVTRDELVGKPVALAFWSLEQEAAIPTAALYADFARRGREAGLEVLLIADSSTDPMRVREFLRTHPLTGLRIGIDALESPTLKDYWIKADGHGLPRVLLIDRQGHVRFEGDPGLRAGKGWAPGAPTYVDEPLEKLLADSGN